ncbi:MAG: tRNA preQ1(34) S-adenosylmethionine ribosyltransferase-isomerase QueA [Chloroflexi bacterium]|nr:tRNA preQ1(34) S-adenosylmethionine ribosyltransferase-isomerase QueA [Chloroflexota bacterium]
MKTSDFDYLLPDHLIAQIPVEPRDQSRLLVINRALATTEHRHFYDIVDYLQPGDLLVANDSRVIPARLRGHKLDSGGQVEILLLRQLEPGVWETLVRPGSRLKDGAKIQLGEHGWAEVLTRTPQSTRLVRFSNEEALEIMGTVPLPHYIHEPLANPERYQTIYAQARGSVAAPTAGLHFTPSLMERIRNLGAQIAFVTLHVGWDSFRPVREEDAHRHPIHKEWGELKMEVVKQIQHTQERGGRIIVVGTTTMRLLESVALKGDDNGLSLRPYAGWVDLLILPGHQFRMADAIVTNFHLPRSTHLMLVSAFAGTELIKGAYQEAVKEGYRFYSFGDAMLIL